MGGSDCLFVAPKGFFRFLRAAWDGKLIRDTDIRACVMANITSELARRPRGSWRGRRNLSLWLCFLLLFGLAGSSRAEAADIQQSGPVTTVGPGPQFAIADFDGDVRPDLASIQAGSNGTGSANYWIQLQLTSTGRQSIQLVGPAGGLQIEARDVNGDHAIDLVLTTAWFRQPVAILLNNGHGSFSRVEPAAFHGAFNESKTSWGSASNQAIDAVGVPPQSRAGTCSEARGLLHGRSPTGSIPPSSSGFVVSPLLISHAGRAPP